MALFEHHEDGPSSECVAEGAVVFHRDHLSGLDVSSPGRAGRQLLRLGARLWRERLRSAEQADDPSEDEETEDDKVWDAARVATILASVVRRASHGLRRAVWLTAMTEVSVAWQQPGAGGARWRVLDVSDGDVVQRSWHESAGEVAASIPPRHVTPVLTRQRCFSPPTYDRLRVLTTELRRVTATTDRVEVCFGPRQRLRGPRLARALQWV